MMNKEEYNRELIRMWDSLRTECKGDHMCYGVSCEDCPLSKFEYACSRSNSAFETVDVVEKWSKEHPQKHKISKLEFDILEAIFEERLLGSDYLKFSDLWILRRLLKKGYFNGATSETNVKYYFDNCEVKEDV